MTIGRQKTTATSTRCTPQRPMMSIATTRVARTESFAVTTLSGKPMAHYEKFTTRQTARMVSEQLSRTTVTRSTRQVSKGSPTGRNIRLEVIKSRKRTSHTKRKHLVRSTPGRLSEATDKTHPKMNRFIPKTNKYIKLVSYNMYSIQGKHSRFFIWFCKTILTINIF